MPLRKHGTIIPSTALVVAIAAAIVPSSASAGIALWPGAKTPTPKPVATPTPTPKPAATPTPAASSSSSIATAAVNAAGNVASAAINTATTTAAVASAAATTAPAGCTPMNTTKAFSKFGDTADYGLAPGGDFESGAAGWKLTTGAKIVSGNENLGVTGGSKSLELPVGATATSPAFCVDESNPYFRFASKVSSLDGGYAAIVIYRDANGKATQAQFTSSSDGTFYNSSSGWGASAVSPLATKIPLLNGGGTASVQLLFVGTTKAYGFFVGAKANIDSVMVDPYRRG